MRFTYVPFGQRAPAGAVACDGLVEGATLHLSHWAHNRTPARLKRDTSVEIALAFAAERSAHDVELATNNHFDADGVLAVWTLLSPDIARAHAELITAAAEVGDFDAWPRDERGFALEALIARRSAIGGDARSYARLLPALDDLVPNLTKYEAEWGEAVRALLDAEKLAARVDVWREGRIAVFAHERGAAHLPGPWLTRLAPAGTDRWLLVTAREGGTHDYQYELPRHAWADTVTRAPIVTPPRGALRRALGEGWVIKGRRGMTGLMYSRAPLGDRPEEVARRLAESDHTPHVRAAKSPG